MRAGNPIKMLSAPAFLLRKIALSLQHCPHFLPLAKNALGALAQLVEHLLCKQRVSGSNPLSSTISIHQKFLSIGLPVDWIFDIV